MLKDNQTPNEGQQAGLETQIDGAAQSEGQTGQNSPVSARNGDEKVSESRHSTLPHFSVHLGIVQKPIERLF